MFVHHGCAVSEEVRRGYQLPSHRSYEQWVASHHVRPGNQTLVLHRSSKCSSLLSNLLALGWFLKQACALALGVHASHPSIRETATELRGWCERHCKILPQNEKQNKIKKFCLQFFFPSASSSVSFSLINPLKASHWTHLLSTPPEHTFPVSFTRLMEALLPHMVYISMCQFPVHCAELLFICLSMVWC